MFYMHKMHEKYVMVTITSHNLIVINRHSVVFYHAVKEEIMPNCMLTSK